MANSTSEIVPIFVPILWISKDGLDRGYSQFISICVIFGFPARYMSYFFLWLYTACSDLISFQSRLDPALFEIIKYLLILIWKVFQNTRYREIRALFEKLDSFNTGRFFFS